MGEWSAIGKLSWIRFDRLLPCKSASRYWTANAQPGNLRNRPTLRNPDLDWRIVPASPKLEPLIMDEMSDKAEWLAAARASVRYLFLLDVIDQ